MAKKVAASLYLQNEINQYASLSPSLLIICVLQNLPPLIFGLVLFVIKLCARAHPSVVHGRVGGSVGAEVALLAHEDGIVLIRHFGIFVLGGQDYVGDDCVLGVGSVVETGNLTIVIISDTLGYIYSLKREKETHPG